MDDNLSGESMNTFLWLGLLLSLLVSPLAGAQVYKWKDAEGNTIYSQIPPADGTPSERIHTTPAPPGATEAAKQQLDALKKRLNDQQKQRKEVAKKTEQEEKKQAALRENCARARASLAELEYKANPLIADGKGGYRRMTAEEHDAKVRQLRQDVDKYCR